MKRIILAALVMSASIGSQPLMAAMTGTAKVGVLTFALSDDFQSGVYLNGVLATNTVYSDAVFNCAANLKYVKSTTKIDNKAILKAIGQALHLNFSARAQLAIADYDNSLPAPPYPPYLAALFEPGVFYSMAVDYNGPRDYATGVLISTDLATLGEFYVWPNNAQIDWVVYDEVNSATVDLNAETGANVGDNLWPKAQVWVYDPANAACVEVSAFFSFEEAYCYFCWDTVDRVTGSPGTLKFSSASEICIGRGGCSISGSGITKFYLTVKFNNDVASNHWLDSQQDDPPPFALSSVANRLIFTAGGVVTYPWTIKALNNAATPFGTMTMGQANGFASTPWCGVLTGSIKIVETDNSKISTDCLELPPEVPYNLPDK